MTTLSTSTNAGLLRPGVPLAVAVFAIYAVGTAIGWLVIDNEFDRTERGAPGDGLPEAPQHAVGHDTLVRRSSVASSEG